MGRWLTLVPLVFVFSLASCAFLLDFDELQAGDGAGPDAAAGTGGTGGTGGSSGSSSGTSGSAGGGGSSGTGPGDGGGCPESCADTDPCTVDRCDTSASPPRCVNDRLVKDGVSESLVADEMYRVTMTSGGDAFYYSVFEQTNMSPEVTLYELTREGTASRELAKVSSIPLFGPARSAGGLVVDTSQGFKLHAFPAFGNDVWHIIFDSTFAVGVNNSHRVGIGTYDSTIAKRHPVAMKLANGEIVGAWINTDGTVSVGSATRTATALSPTGVVVSQIAPLGAGNTPGVLWTGPSGVNAQLLGGTPSPVAACNTEPGVYLSATSAEILPGFWIASWTKAGNNYLVNEGKGLGCSGTTCTGEATCDPADQATPGLRNPALATAARSSDPPGTVLLASATPVIGPDQPGGSLTSAILLNLQRMVIEQGPPLRATTQDIGSVELARMPPGPAPNLEGPDWPAISILPPNKIAVAWLEPGASGGDRLRVERYKICLP
jgi:hypothetical protein